MHKIQASFLVLFFYLSIIFIAPVLCEEGISFKFSEFSTSDDQIVREGDVMVCKSQLEVTAMYSNADLKFSQGRATYHKPMHLWEESAGKVADFTTHFSFVIDSKGKETFADGLAFFLAPNGSRMPEKSMNGRLGLVNGKPNPFDPSTTFVAVEFDSHCGTSWDPIPGCYHVGIDLNNISSVNFTCVDWFGDKIMAGGKINASITYDSSTQNLSVIMIDTKHPRRHVARLSHSVDLTKYLPEWVTFGFSATSGSRFESHTLHSWEFNSSKVSATGEPTFEPDTFRSKRITSWELSIIVLGSLLLLTLALGSVWYARKSNRMEEQDDVMAIDDEFDKVTGPKKFSSRDLVAATNNFADARLLGEGGFGRVYEGRLIGINGMNTSVAIKKITSDSRQGIKEYATEVKTISQLKHRNLVQLIGWCHEKKELLLVYEFMSNGSLDSHLFKHKTFLTWEERYRIAQAIASALLYLHEEWEKCVVHRDIKPSNILLDSDFNAKLGDFGLARLIDHAKGSRTTAWAGTMGYIAPECIYTGKASKESDVFSFGIVLLEIACGRRVVDSRKTEDQVWLLAWVWELNGTGKLLNAVDPRLDSNFDENQMKRLMIVGLWCSHPDSKVRPSIREALSLLKFDGSPPALPSTLPVPSYFGPPPSMVSSWILHSSAGTSS